MKYKDYVLKELEKTTQLMNTTITGMNNSTISAEQTHKNLVSLQKQIQKISARIDLEYDDAR